MFNEVRMFNAAEPVRLWAAYENGRYVIWPNGIMRFLPHAQIAAMPLAPAEAVAFPVQDQGNRK